MAIEIDGKIYRNLQEQVAANTNDIAELKEKIENLEERVAALEGNEEVSALEGNEEEE